MVQALKQSLSDSAIYAVANGHNSIYVTSSLFSIIMAIILPSVGKDNLPKPCDVTLDLIASKYRSKYDSGTLISNRWSTLKSG